MGPGPISIRPSFDQNWTFATGATAVDTPLELFVRAFEYPNGYRGNFHKHRLQQVVYPVRGLVRVDTADQQITLAPFRASVIPSWSQHRVSAIGNASLRSVFVAPERIADREVLRINPLLHELINEAGTLYGDVPPGSYASQVLNLIGTMLDRSVSAEGLIALPRVTLPRLAPVFERIIEQPEAFDLAASNIADQVALSSRQFRRLFKTDTGIPYKDWRNQLRVKRAAEKLIHGEPVTRVAVELGFSSSSAFGQVFKRLTGMTPGQFARLEHPVLTR